MMYTYSFHCFHTRTWTAGLVLTTDPSLDNLLLSQQTLISSSAFTLSSFSITWLSLSGCRYHPQHPPPPSLKIRKMFTLFVPSSTHFAIALSPYAQNNGSIHVLITSNPSRNPMQIQTTSQTFQHSNRHLATPAC